MTESVHLDAASVDAIARRVVDLLGEQCGARTAALVDAATVARALGISRATVYEHADQLGARRLADAAAGRKPRLRFDLERAVAAWKTRASAAPAVQHAPQRTSGRRRPRRADQSGLLPIRDREAA